MAISRGPKLVTNGLVLALDPSDDNSFAAQNLPIKNGLILWLDAADDDSFVYSSGTVVSQWRDKSGLNNHVAQSTVASQPNRNVVKNSRKSIYFDGGDTLFNSGNVFPSNTTDYTKIAVVYQTSTATTGNVIGCRSSASGNNYRHTIYFGGLNFRMWHDADIVTSSISLSLNTLGIISATYVNSSGLGSVFVNGTASGTGTAANRNIVQDIEIGGLNGGNNYTGEICEVLVFSRVLSATELKQVHTYLGQKWGILNTDRTIVDLSGNNNNGLLGNGTTADMPFFDFYNKGALKLDGSTDYIAISDSAVLSPSTVTVSLWIKRNSYQSSITNFLRRNDFDSYALMATNNSDTVWFRIRNSVAAVADAQTSMPLNTWVNLVGTFDGSNVRIYKDGAFANIVANTSPINYAATNSTMIIGRDDAVSGRYAPASYGSILIYSRALSAAEILQNYNAQKGKYLNTIVQQGLVLNLDAGNNYSYAGSGTTWYDVSGNTNNGTLTNGPTYNTTNSGVITLDGIDDYITCANSASLQITSALTLETWFYNTATVNGLGMIVKGPLSSDYDYMLFLSGNSTTAYFYKKDSGGGIHYSGTTLSLLNRWLHIVVTHTSGGVYTMYANGVAIDSAGFSNSTIRSTSNPLFIGAGWNPDYFYGNIGETRIYNVALSAAQVLQNYNATKGRFGL